MSEWDESRGSRLRELVFKNLKNRPSGRDLEEGQEFRPRAWIELDSRALVNNFKAIQALVPGQEILPMVKANAYGHGTEWVSRSLTGFAGLYGFGVATLEEGAELRQTLGVKARKTRILVFSGCAHWSEAKGQFCERHGLTPVIVGDADWQGFLKGGWPARLPYEIKFNTGMNRLGLSVSMVRMVARALRALPPESHPSGVLTHLAMSEQPDARLSVQQRERFAAIKAELAPAAPGARFHIANSGAIWGAKRWGLEGLTDVVRPGLALYGVPPWSDAPLRGLAPVMTYYATVVAVQALKAGESLGYGASFKVSGKEKNPVQVAILSAGYADGVKRALSNQGYGWLGGQVTRFLGMVSMDLSAVGAFSSTRVGDRVELIGPHVDPWAQARAAATIPYELLTSVSARVQRKHV